MAQLSIKPDSVDVTLSVYVLDGSGVPRTGLTHTTSALTCYYWRLGSSPTPLTLAAQTVNGAHTDGGFVALDGTNMPGWYRLDLSDAVVAAGVRSVGITLRGASNMRDVAIELDLKAEVDAVAVSGDYPAADAFETMLDGTSGSVLSLKQLAIYNPNGTALVTQSAGDNGHGWLAVGHGTGLGAIVAGGNHGHGMFIVGGQNENQVTTHGLYCQAGAWEGTGLRGQGALAPYGTDNSIGIGAIGGQVGGDGLKGVAYADGFSGAKFIGQAGGPGIYAMGGETGAGAIFGGGGVPPQNGPPIGPGSGPGAIFQGGATTGAGATFNGENGEPDIDANLITSFWGTSVFVGVATATGSSATAIALNATTGIDGGVPSSANGQYTRYRVIGLTGNLAGYVTNATNYVGSTKIITVDSLPVTAANGDTFLLVPCQ
jgi:hypothetical protein